MSLWTALVPVVTVAELGSPRDPVDILETGSSSCCTTRLAFLGAETDYLPFD